ncbi:hypothetical protein BW897_32095 [Bacillus cereus]|uniref:Uncharacterized protein n=1 Tax=Bacillus cereus TaxID=1396 RepID=A0A1S9T301_BACCE|nr:hypothetical protein BW897_32095 [Bacillus cereus]
MLNSIKKGKWFFSHIKKMVRFQTEIEKGTHDNILIQEEFIFPWIIFLLRNLRKHIQLDNIKKGISS